MAHKSHFLLKVLSQSRLISIARWVIPVSMMLVFTVGCTARDTVTVVRNHAAKAQPVASSETPIETPPVLTFAAVTRDELDFTYVYDKSNPAYAVAAGVAANAAARGSESEKNVWLHLATPVYHLCADDEGRLLYIGGVETVYGEDDYRIDYHLYRTDSNHNRTESDHNRKENNLDPTGGETPQPVLTALGYYRQQGEVVDFKQVVGLAPLDDGAWLVVYQTRTNQDDPSTMTYTVYGRDFTVLVSEQNWPGKTGQYAVMRYYDGMVYYVSGMRQLYAVPLENATIETPLSALNTAVFGFDIDAEGLLHIIYKKPRAMHFTYSIYDAATGTEQRAVTFYGQGQLPYRVAINPADDTPYAAGNNHISRLTVKAPHINAVYDMEMRLHEDRYAAADGFVFDRAGNAYVAKLTDSGAEIWRFSEPELAPVDTPSAAPTDTTVSGEVTAP